jgi:hypothetical protein
VYYLPGTTGWGATWGGWNWPTAFWQTLTPVILTSANGNTNFGLQSNRFGFIVSWAANASVMVEACDDLANPVWQPLKTNTFIVNFPSGGWFYFSDPGWTNYPSRFYGIGFP